MSQQYEPVGWAGLIEVVDDEAPTIDTSPPPPALNLPTPTGAPRLFVLSDLPPALPKAAPPPAPANRRALYTILLGLAVFGGSLMLRDGIAPSDAPAPPPDPRGPSQLGPTEASPAPEVHATPPKVSPVLSVFTEPVGAQVEVGGKVYGNSPLIIPSPDPHSLMITLRLPGHQVWTEVVRPNEAGHFQVQAALRPGLGGATTLLPSQRPDPRPRRAPHR